MQKHSTAQVTTPLLTEDKIREIIDRVMKRGAISDHSIECYVEALIETELLAELKAMVQDKKVWRDLIKKKLEDYRDQLIDSMVSKYASR